MSDVEATYLWLVILLAASVVVHLLVDLVLQHVWAGRRRYDRGRR